MIPKEEDCRRRYRGVFDTLSPNLGAEILRYGWSKPGVLSLGQGEGCRVTPDFIIDAAMQAAKEGKTFYGPVLGVQALREEISAYYKRIYDLDMPVNRIYVTSSGTTAMHLALTSVLDEGDEVLAVTPIWKNLMGAVELAEARIMEMPLDFDEKTGWSLDLDKFFDSVTDKTKALLLVTPSNPTGWVMPEPIVAEIVKFAREKDLWIIADEVYARLVYEGRAAPSFLEVADPLDKLFVVNSFSKAWAMTGWRLGWLIGPSCAENKIRDLILYDNLGVSNFIQYGGIEALKNGESFIEDQLNLWKRNQETLNEFFSNYPKVLAAPSDAGFYSFFKVEGEENCVDFARRLIDEAKLSIAPGISFGKSTKGWMRLCYAVSEQKLADGLNRLAKVL